MPTSVWLPATPGAIAWACPIIVGAMISRFFFFHTGVNSCILSVSFVTGQIFGTISMVVGLAAATNMLALSNYRDRTFGLEFASSSGHSSWSPAPSALLSLSWSFSGGATTTLSPSKGEIILLYPRSNDKIARACDSGGQL